MLYIINYPKGFGFTSSYSYDESLCLLLLWLAKFLNIFLY